MNKITLTGEVLTKEFLLRKTPEDVPVTSFLLKVSRDNKRITKSNQDKFDIFTIVCWNEIAEKVVNTFQAGMTIWVDGSVQNGRRKLKGHTVYKDGKEVPNFQLPFSEVYAHNIKHIENL